MLCEEAEELAESSSENESLAESFESIPPLEFHSDSEASAASSLMVPPGFASEDDGEALGVFFRYRSCTHACFWR